MTKIPSVDRVESEFGLTEHLDYLPLPILQLCALPRDPILSLPQKKILSNGKDSQGIREIRVSQRHPEFNRTKPAVRS